MSQGTKRNPVKIRRILKQRGCKGGEAPRGKEVHHVKPVAKGGRDTPKNIRVVPSGKHRKIRRERRKRGGI